MLKILLIRILVGGICIFVPMPILFILGENIFGILIYMICAVGIAYVLNKLLGQRWKDATIRPNTTRIIYSFLIF